MYDIQETVDYIVKNINEKLKEKEMTEWERSNEILYQIEIELEEMGRMIYKEASCPSYYE